MLIKRSKIFAFKESFNFAFKRTSSMTPYLTHSKSYKQAFMAIIEGI